MQEVALELLALAIYGPLVVLLHEGGHAAFARLGGYRVTSFGIGLGKPLWRVQLSGGVVLHIDRWLFAGGACVAIPTRPPTMRRAWFHGGGLLVQAALALLLLALPDVWLFDRIERFNVLVAMTNLVPWRLAGSASDGWFLWDALTGGRRTGEIITQRDQLERMADREEATGSPLGTMYARLCLAWVDVLTGRPERTAAFFEEDPPQQTAAPWIDALYHYVHAEWHRLERRPLASLRTVRETRAALADELAEESAGLLAIAEARALLDLDAPEQAMRALARVSGVAGPIGRQASVVHLGALLDGDPDELQFATWRVVRRSHEVWLDPADTAVLLWQAAERLEAQMRIHAARGAREAARTLARRVLSRVSTEDRAPLTRRIGPAAGYVPSGSMIGGVWRG